MTKRPVVPRDEWLDARRELLAREKQLTRLRDELSAERRALPWVELDDRYVFAGPEGEVRLADLFGESSQLVIYHFMLPPGADEGCSGCSFVADHLAGPLLHLKHHDVALAAVSRAPIDEIEKFKQRMGWTFTWVSSFDSDFNRDFDVSFLPEDVERGDTVYNYKLRENQTTGEAPGASVFTKDDTGTVFHTYSTYARGLEEVLGAYMLIDLTPRGRRESFPMDWVRLHDSYES